MAKAHTKKGKTMKRTAQDFLDAEKATMDELQVDLFNMLNRIDDRLRDYHTFNHCEDDMEKYWERFRERIYSAFDYVGGGKSTDDQMMRLWHSEIHRENVEAMIERKNNE